MHATPIGITLSDGRTLTPDEYRAVLKKRAGKKRARIPSITREPLWSKRDELVIQEIKSSAKTALSAMNLLRQNGGTSRSDGTGITLRPSVRRAAATVHATAKAVLSRNEGKQPGISSLGKALSDKAAVGEETTPSLTGSEQTRLVPPQSRNDQPTAHPPTSEHVSSPTISTPSLNSSPIAPVGTGPIQSGRPSSPAPSISSTAGLLGTYRSHSVQTALPSSAAPVLRLRPTQTPPPFPDLSILSTPDLPSPLPTSSNSILPSSSSTETPPPYTPLPTSLAQLPSEPGMSIIPPPALNIRRELGRTPSAGPGRRPLPTPIQVDHTSNSSGAENTDEGGEEPGWSFANLNL